ncbi:hypothetical protein PG994_013309 [Apiospora phragmitis]|uniref:Uncharacterized protein n=1 Tax=Apiospora phragmitis TaxID=2905665 RepID=A0ABR1T896_9PEZI
MALRSTLRSQKYDFTTQKGISSLIAVANDDDLLDFLYVDGNHHHADSSKIIINHVIEPLHEDDLTPFSNQSTGVHTPSHEDDDEDAVLSDLPSESEEDLEIPPSPPTPQRRHRGATSVGEDDFEFPVFVGRQRDESPMPPHQQPSATRPPFQRAEAAQSVTATITAKKVQFHEPDVPADHHVVSVEGPVMSWWPAPIDTLEYDWVVKNQRAAEEELQQQEQERATKKIKTVAVESHVADLEGPLMAWWPAPAELLEYDWFERFYE